MNLLEFVNKHTQWCEGLSELLGDIIKKHNIKYNDEEVLDTLDFVDANIDALNLDNFSRFKIILHFLFKYVNKNGKLTFNYLDYTIEMLGNENECIKEYIDRLYDKTVTLNNNRLIDTVIGDFGMQDLEILPVIMYKDISDNVNFFKGYIHTGRSIMEILFSKNINKTMLCELSDEYEEYIDEMDPDFGCNSPAIILIRTALLNMVDIKFKG